MLGAVRVPRDDIDDDGALEVTDAMMSGVVSLPHGYGHGREGVRLSVASTRPGVSVNDVSDELHIDALSGNAAFNGLSVTVERAATS